MSMVGTSVWLPWQLVSEDGVISRWALSTASSCLPARERELHPSLQMFRHCLIWQRFWPAPWKRTRLEKQIFAEFVKKYYGIRRYIAFWQESFTSLDREPDEQLNLSLFSKNPFNIILPSTSGSSKQTLYFGFKYVIQHPVLENFSLCFSVEVNNKAATPRQNKTQINVICVLVLLL